VKTELASDTDPTNDVTPKKENPVGKRTHREWTREGPFFTGPRQNLHHGTHPGGKEFFLLRPKSPICEAASWIAIL